MKKLCIVGLGYVGLPLAIAFGKSRPVIGFDNNPQRVMELLDGKDASGECSPESLQAATHLQVTADEEYLADASIYIVSVPTPVDENNEPDLSPVIEASVLIAKYLSVGDIVIYESTGFPGMTEEICVPELEMNSGLTFNVDFFCGYSPERINPGDIKCSLENVVKVTSGSTEAVAQEVDLIYQEVALAGTYLAQSIKVAEAAKILENTQRDVNIALINEVSSVLNSLNIDTAQVISAASTKWNFMKFFPGLVGGHCIGVDPYYLAHRAKAAGKACDLILTARNINNSVAESYANEFVKVMTKQSFNLNNSTIAILGITFKENCPDIRNSKVFDLIKSLRDWGVTIIVTDPVADALNVNQVYGEELIGIENISDVDAVIVAVGHDSYRDMPPEILMSMIKDRSRAVLGDLKSIYDKKICEDLGFRVVRL